MMFTPLDLTFVLQMGSRWNPVGSDAITDPNQIR